MDFSPSALQALGVALDLARQSDGIVTVVHALEWLAEEEPREYTHFNVPEYRQYLIDDARHRVQALVADMSQTWSAIDARVVLGRAYREILRVAADSGTDLIVMGAQGRGALGLPLFGSTTQQVVRAATCPVLIVRSAASSAQGERRGASVSWIVDMKVMLLSRLHELDFAITGWMARFGPMLLRVSLGIVFLWFGLLKFFPNLSPGVGDPDDQHFDRRPDQPRGVLAAPGWLGMSDWTRTVARSRTAWDPTAPLRTDARHADAARPVSA